MTSASNRDQFSMRTSPDRNPLADTLGWNEGKAPRQGCRSVLEEAVAIGACQPPSPHFEQCPQVRCRIGAVDHDRIESIGLQPYPRQLCFTILDHVNADRPA